VYTDILEANTMSEHATLDIKKSLIRKQPVFAKFTTEEIDVLASLLTEKHFPADTIIVNEGDPVDSIYLIVSGTADVRHVFIKDHAIQSVSLATLHPGESIGLKETGFYSLTGKRTATVIAITDMVAMHLSMAAFHGFALNYSHANQIMRSSAMTTDNKKTN
jgi:CRP-like cAMP-binding protein